MNRQQLFFMYFVGVGIVALLVSHLIRARLERRHPVLFARLGNPKFQDSNLEAKYWAFQKFVFWGYFSVKDSVLATLCVIATIAGVVGTTLFVLCIVQ